MEPPDFESLNISAQPTAFTHPVCARWRDGAEGAVYHLSSVFLVLGFMGGSGLYGLLYLFTFLTLGFFCSTVWAWSDPCTTDSFLWTLALFGTCLGQTLHVSYRLRSVTFEKEFEDLYNSVFKKLGVSLTHYGKIVVCCERDVQTLDRDHCFAVEGKTAIDKLSVLLTGRIRVTVNGEFLHYIYPFQFLDSPEWDSLRPSEEGIFQVTLRAENCCRYVTWRRKKLYLLFAKHRYLAKIFALVVRNDIADKLYSLNEKAFDGSGHRYDLRLPSFCHPPTLTPDQDGAEGLLLPPTPSPRQDKHHHPSTSITVPDKPGTLLHPSTPVTDQDGAEGRLLPPIPSVRHSKLARLRHSTLGTDNNKPGSHPHPSTPLTDQDGAEGLLLPPTPSARKDKPARVRPPTPVTDQDKPQPSTSDTDQDKTGTGQDHSAPVTDQDPPGTPPHPSTSFTVPDKPGTQLYPITAVTDPGTSGIQLHPLPPTPEQEWGAAEGWLGPLTPSAEQDGDSV